ncbi:MAG: insulinase family protein [Myxococcaceae bacterium]|jgi:zinc protease|nr:insulinase family protein [Myxococcaceae bacterium]
MPKPKPRPKATVKLSPALSAIADSVIEAKLANGLRVRLLPNDAVPTCSYYTFFRVGARNERPGITGISHLFEHMMFNGAKKYGPGMFDKELESNGGSSNAYTSNDLTVYYEDFMAEALEKVVDLESDRMRSLAVTPKMLASERQVVIEERRLRVDNEISGMMDEELGSLVYKAHPYRWPVIGWMRDIENISREDCLEYFRTFYAPNNATIYVSGDFDPKQALALIKRAYGGLKAGPPAPPVLDAEPEQKGERRADVHYPAQAPSLMIAWRGPAGSHADTLVLDVVQYALSVGQSSRLHRRLVHDLELAVGVSVDWTWRFDPGTFTVGLELKPGGDPKQAEAALTAELERLAAEGLTARELEKAKNNLAATLTRELATNSGRAHALGTYELMLGDWRRGLALPSAYESITSEQVKEVVRRYLTPARRNVVTLVPQSSVEAAA